jgi:hypothetical protein
VRKANEEVETEEVQSSKGREAFLFLLLRISFPFLFLLERYHCTDKLAAAPIKSYND